MKKIISNLSVMIFVIGCVIMEITTWFIDSYVMFYIGIIIVIVGTIGMIIQGKFKKVIGKRQTMRQSLKSTPPIIGDVASCIRPEDYLTMA